MPRVPTYDPNVTPDPLRPAFQTGQGATLDAFGINKGTDLRALGAGLTNASDTISALVLQQQAEDNERMAKQLDTQLQTQIRLALYGDGTEQNPGFRSLMGENALNQSAATQKLIEDTRRKLMEQAPNQRVQEMFGLAATERLNSAYTNIAEHTSTQRVQANVNASTARIAMAAEDIATEGENPALLAKHLAIMNNEVMALNELQGGNEETLAIKLQEAQSVAFTNLVERVMVDDPVKAGAIYEANKDLIDAATRADLEKKLFDANIFALSQSIAEEAVALHPGNVSAQRQYIRDAYDGKAESYALEELNERINEARGDLSEAREAVRWDQYLTDLAIRDTAATAATGISDPIQARVVMETLNAQDNLNAAAEQINRQAVTDAQRNAYEAIDGGQSFGDWATENPDAYGVLLAEGEIPGLRKRAAQLAQGNPFAEVDATDTMAIYNALSVQDLAAYDPNAVKQFVTEPTYQKMVAEVAAAQAQLSATGIAREVYTAGREYLKNYSPKLRWDGSKPAPTPEMLVQQRELERQMNAFILANPTANSEQLRQEAVRLTLPLTVPGGGWFGDSSLAPGEIANMTPEERATVTVDLESIPADWQANINAAIATAIAEGSLPPSAASNEDLVEALAGALAMQDYNRAARLLGEGE